MFLSAAELKATKAKLAKINDRAAKRGFTGRFDLVSEKTTRTHTNSLGIDIITHGYDAHIEGEAPSYEGWTFLAKVTTVGDSVVIANAPGVVHEVKNSEIDGGKCEHCNSDRNRKHTYLVRGEDGEIKQVGSTCLKDFLGWDGSFVFIDEKDVEGQLERSLGSRTRDYDIITVAKLAFAVADKWGYVSASNYSAKAPATKDVVMDILLDNKVGREYMMALMGTTFLEDSEVEARIAEVLGSFTQDHGYQANMRAVLTAETIDYSNMGFAVSIASVYKRLHEEKIEREVKAAEKPSEWIGNVGDKIEFEGTIVMWRIVHSDFGSNNLIAVKTADNNVIKMFTKAQWTEGVDEGSKVKIKAAVKKHEEYNGRHETLVNRPKMVS